MNLLKPAKMFMLLAVVCLASLLSFIFPLHGIAGDTPAKDKGQVQTQGPTLSYQTQVHCLSWGGGVPGIQKLLNDTPKKGLTLVSFATFPDFRKGDTVSKDCYLFIFKK